MAKAEPQPGRPRGIKTVAQYQGDQQPGERNIPPPQLELVKRIESDSLDSFVADITKHQIEREEGLIRLDASKVGKTKPEVVRIGEKEIVFHEVLGEGGMGLVVSAAVDGKPMAMKITKPITSLELFRLYCNEAHIHRQIAQGEVVSKDALTLIQERILDPEPQIKLMKKLKEQGRLRHDVPEERIPDIVNRRIAMLPGLAESVGGIDNAQKRKNAINSLTYGDLVPRIIGKNAPERRSEAVSAAAAELIGRNWEQEYSYTRDKPVFEKTWLDDVVTTASDLAQLRGTDEYTAELNRNTRRYVIELNKGIAAYPQSENDFRREEGEQDLPEEFVVVKRMLEQNWVEQARHFKPDASEEDLEYVLSSVQELAGEFNEQRYTSLLKNKTSIEFQQLNYMQRQDAADLLDSYVRIARYTRRVRRQIDNYATMVHNLGDAVDAVESLDSGMRKQLYDAYELGIPAGLVRKQVLLNEGKTNPSYAVPQYFGQDLIVEKDLRIPAIAKHFKETVRNKYAYAPNEVELYDPVSQEILNVMREEDVSSGYLASGAVQTALEALVKERERDIDSDLMRALAKNKERILASLNKHAANNEQLVIYLEDMTKRHGADERIDPNRHIHTVEQYVWENYFNMTMDEKLALSIGIVSSLRKLHEDGIVHGDIKGANAVVDPNALMRPALLDYGLANPFKITQQPVQTGRIPGTPVFMSPELVNETVIDNRTPDIVAAGVLLYEIYDMNKYIEAAKRAGLTYLDVIKYISKKGSAIGSHEDILHEAAEEEKTGNVQKAQYLKVVADCIRPASSRATAREVEAALVEIAASPGRSDLDTLELPEYTQKDEGRAAG
ncbi:MAG: protein kinase [Candidatus Kerfeldbacteria bacterium]